MKYEFHYMKNAMMDKFEVEGATYLHAIREGVREIDRMKEADLDSVYEYVSLVKVSDDGKTPPENRRD